MKNADLEPAKIAHPDIDVKYKIHSHGIENDNSRSLVMFFPLQVDKSKFSGVTFSYTSRHANEPVSIGGSLTWGEMQNKAITQIDGSMAIVNTAVNIYYSTCGPSYTCSFTASDADYDFQCRASR